MDLQAIPRSQIQVLSTLFYELAPAEFERTPAMAHCPARRSLDDGLSDILGLPNLAKFRDLLASEPVVFNLRL